MKLIEKFLFWSMKVLLEKSYKIIVLSMDYYEHCKINSSSLSPKVYPLFPYYYYDTPPKYKTDYRKKYNIPSNAFVIGFLGRIVYEKGIDYLINAFKLFKDKISTSILLIGGDYQKVRGGSVYDKLKGEIDSLGNSVIVTGFIPEDEKDDFFSAMDIFVLPSIDPLEAFGIVQLEAMKNNIPVISSFLPGVREIVQKTGYGSIFDVKSSEDLAKKLAEMYTSYKLLESNNSNYKKHYNKQAWLNAFDRILNDS